MNDNGTAMRDAANGIDLSVIIPMYNAEAFIERRLCELAEFLRRSPWVFEIIVVDDASRDSSMQRVKALDLPELRLFAFRSNGGKFAAIKRGMRAARGRCCVFSDADGCCAFVNLSEMVVPILKGHADFVLGDRHLDQSRYLGGLPWFRRFLSRAFAFFVNTVLGLPFGDTQCGLKAMSKNATGQLFSQLKEKRFVGDVELLVLARLLELRVRRVPVELAFQGPSTVRITRDGLAMLWGVLRLRRRYNDALSTIQRSNTEARADRKAYEMVLRSSPKSISGVPPRVLPAKHIDYPTVGFGAVNGTSQDFRQSKLAPSKSS